MKDIIVVGKNRSGTKWLSNIIANNNEVACIQSQRYNGILETNVFHRMPEVFGSLKVDDNFVPFIEVFSKTSFFKLTGLNKDFLYENRTDNYYDFFENLMDEYCKKQEKECWVQKTSPYKFDKVYNNYFNKKFIVVERNPIDNIRSTIGLHRRLKKSITKNVLRELLRYIHRIKIMEKYKGKDNFLFIKFEDLKDNTEKVVKEVCEFSNLNYNENMLNNKFKKNTSFSREIDKDKVLNNKEKFIIKVSYPVLNLIPNLGYHLLWKLYRNIFGPIDNRKFIEGTFDLFKEEINFK